MKGDLIQRLKDEAEHFQFLKSIGALVETSQELLPLLQEAIAALEEMQKVRAKTYEVEGFSERSHMHYCQTTKTRDAACDCPAESHNEGVEQAFRELRELLPTPPAAQ